MMDGAEFELEVTDLRSGKPQPHPLAGDASSPRGRRPTPLPRLNTGRASLALGTVLLAVLLLTHAGASPDLLGLLVHRAPSTPQARLGVGADTLYFAHSVPWGRLTLDGRTLGDADYSVVNTGLDPPFVWLRLARGPHTLVYRAAPFPTLRCELSVPASPADTCPLLRPGRDTDVTQLPAVQRILDLGATPARLPAAQLAALQATVTSTLARVSSATTVAPGTSVLAPDGGVRAAQRSLTATLLFAAGSGTRLSTLDANGNLITLPCLVLCASRGLLGSDDPHAWTLFAQVRPHWQFADQADDRTTFQSPAAAPPITADGLLRLAVTWDGATWQAAPSSFAPANPTCDTGVAILMHHLPAFALGNFQFGNLRLSVLSAPVAAAGCLLSLSDRRPSIKNPAREALFLYRFGIVSAVEGFATRLTDTLPIASGADAALAQHLASLEV